MVRDDLPRGKRSLQPESRLLGEFVQPIYRRDPEYRLQLVLERTQHTLRQEDLFGSGGIITCAGTYGGRALSP